MNRDLVVIYTDGGVSKDGVGGCGAVLCSNEPGKGLRQLAHRSQHHPGPPPTTNQRMELQAVILGLEALAQSFETASVDVEIYSDSAYVVNCFKDSWFLKWVQNGWLNSAKKPVENADLWRKLLSMTFAAHERCRTALSPRPWEHPGLPQEDVDMLLASSGGLKVKFCKVKGHSGVPMNELADQLATRGKNGETVIWDSGS